MKNKTWPRRAEFVNLVLALAVGAGIVPMKFVVFDGVAGQQFDAAIGGAESDSSRCSDYITLAIKLGVPIEDLVADGVLGEKWKQVVALCKEIDKPGLAEVA